MVPVIYAPEAERDLDVTTAYIAKVGWLRVRCTRLLRDQSGVGQHHK
jgi:hypothetical protein